MRTLIWFVLLTVLTVFTGSSSAQTNAPLRVFIRAGVKTHGPNQHDHPRFLREWTQLLNERGAVARGRIGFPTAEELEATDVLIISAGDGGTMSPTERGLFEKFLNRGGGVVVLHDGIASKDPEWYESLVGGAWEYGRSKFFEGELSFYYLDHESPITREASNFDFDDEEYYDLRVSPAAHILAGTYQPDRRNTHDGRQFPSVYDVAPQMWTYETNNHRAFVSISGHHYKSYLLPHFRAVILRGIAWAGKRDADLFLRAEETKSLRYPEGGPTRPEEAGKKIVVAPGFKLNLVAAEPLIEKPISLDWDAQGRLWVAETPEYPFRKDRSIAPYDRVTILESSKNNGVMDKQTVFCGDLDLVTSMVLYRDGVIVSQAPYILRLRDTDGHGKADNKEILFRGFGTNDTHAVISNLRWGLDGWVYATLGYSRGDIYSGDGSKHFGTLSEGVIRFKPDGSAIEQVASKGGNTWGVDVAPDNEIFFTQANGNHIDHVVMPEAALARGRIGDTTSYLNIEDHHRSFPLMTWKQQAYVQIDYVGNFTAAAGCCIYDGGAWPEKYNYTHYVSEPTVNIVHQDILTPRGVSYVASKDPERAEQEFVASSDLWFRPVHQRVGPDGALYLLDLYNQAVVHNDTRGTRHDPQSNSALRPDRDHYFGRIWRIQHENAKTFAIPNLATVKAAELVAALSHPNEWVRGTALRLLRERNETAAIPALEQLAQSATDSVEARIHALWALNELGAMNKAAGQQILAASVGAADERLQKNALEIVASWGSDVKVSPELREAVLTQTKSSRERVQLEALLAADKVELTSAQIEAMIAVHPALNNGWLQSAFLELALREPVRFSAAALNSGNVENKKDLVINLAERIAESGSAEEAVRLVQAVAAAPAGADMLKVVILKKLGEEVRNAPGNGAAVQAALQQLLKATNGEVVMAAVPLAVKWNQGGAMKSELNGLIEQLEIKVKDGALPDEQRLQIAETLLGITEVDSQIIPAISDLLGANSGVKLQRGIIAGLGRITNATAGAALEVHYAAMPLEVQDAALNQILKRSDWTMAFLDAVEQQKINLKLLGPVAINRLRNHSDKIVAARANKIIDTIRGPEMKEKDALIAQFTPIVMQPGNVEHGKQLFTQNCAVCHRFNGAGKTVAPDLTGMGAHGPAELIIHVLDPNREVEPNYYAYSIETKDGEIYDGVIARENSSGVTLRNSSGDMEIKTADIKSKRNTGLSLMPNGFETLGGENLRDILAYLCAGDSKYRLLDLRPAFTVNSARGMWFSEANAQDSLNFKKFGVVKVEEVPFEIVNPQKSSTGKNVTVLRGGDGYDKTLPQTVEIPTTGISANRLHFLGGVAGWGYPFGGGDGRRDLPVTKVTVHYADHQSEEMILRNGREFADWNGATDVPDSTEAPDMVTHGQLRSFVKPLKHGGELSSITLESYDNAVAPAFVAITAEVGGNAETKPATTTSEAFAWQPNTKHLLLVGGGSSHDFGRWFNREDSNTLAGVAGFSIQYTEDLGKVARALTNNSAEERVDVLAWSSNQKLDDGQLRKEILDFAKAGHGLLLLHPALWYNWQDWPEYNRVLVGGGARGHDKYGDFEVMVDEPGNPILAGVPKEFSIRDELYHAVIDTNGTPVQILAEAKNLTTGEKFPSIWIVKYPNARIVCIAPGHDASTHELPEFKTILRNSLQWAAQSQ